MGTTLRKMGTTAVLEVEGKLALGEPVDEFRTCWYEAFAGGAKHLVVNLAGVPMIDSSGMGCLLKCHAAAVASHGKVKLAGAGDVVRHALQITRLDTVFEFYDNEAAALASIEAAPAKKA